MSDLVKRLRDERDKARISAANYAEFNHEWRRRAEAITAERDELKAKLAKAVAFIDEVKEGPACRVSIPSWVGQKMNEARTTLAELTGGKDE